MIKNIIGHKSTKKQLEIASASSNDRNVAIPHILFSGVAGCGKTTMAMELAHTCNVDFLPVSPDDFTDREATIRILEKLNHTNYDEFGNRTGNIMPTIVFIDEIHRMPRKGQEVMGIAMEKLLLETGKTNKYFWIPHFTLVGATTDDGELTKPFREKFKLRFLFETYSDKEITDIVAMHAIRKHIIITVKAARAIAKRSRGIPRLCVSYLERARDYQQYLKTSAINERVVEENFSNMNIDSIGLTRTEVKLLSLLHDRREPIGLDNMAIVSNESQKNIKNTVEPYLIQKGLIIRGSKGRTITEEGIRHLDENGHLKASRNKVAISPDYVRK